MREEKSWAEIEAGYLREALVRARQELDWKDILIRDTEHRTKNMLQMACALLYKQAQELGVDGQARAALNDTGRRLAAISAAHSLLLQADGMTSASDHIGQICRSLDNEVFGFRIRLDAEPVSCGGDEVAALGLLTSEAVINAAKHAYPDGKGLVDVRFFHLLDRRICLTVRDYGVGKIKAGKGAAGLGEELICAFANQLKGELDVSAADGQGRLLRLIFTPRPAGDRQLGL